MVKEIAQSIKLTGPTQARFPELLFKKNKTKKNWA